MSAWKCLRSHSNLINKAKIQRIFGLNLDQIVFFKFFKETSGRREFPCIHKRVWRQQSRVVASTKNHLGGKISENFISKKKSCYLYPKYPLICTHRNCVETKCIKDLLGDIILAQRVLKCQIKSDWAIGV